MVGQSDGSQANQLGTSDRAISSSPFSLVNMDYQDYLTRMGTDTEGRYDVSPLFYDPKTFETLRMDLLAGVTGEPTAVAGIDALGFVLGSAMAVDLRVGFVPVRKGGKLPYPEEELLRQEFTDYSGRSKALEIHPAALAESDRVLLVDDWVETGVQMRTAANLIEETGASISRIVAIRVHRNQKTEPLFDKYPVHRLG